MNKNEIIKTAAVYLLTMLVYFSSYRSNAEQCWGKLTYSPSGLTNGMSRESVICVQSGTNCNPHEVSICEADIQFTPAPPTMQGICRTDTSGGETGAKCVLNPVSATVTRFLGRPVCSASCSGSCADWDTQRSSPDADLPRNTWHEDSVEICDDGA